MTGNEILALSFDIIGETGGVSDTYDYRIRALRLLNAIAMGQYSLWLDWNHLTTSPFVLLNTLEDTYPFSDRFAYPAAFSLAAQLIADENNAVSARFEQAYNERMKQIQTAISAQIYSIKDVYGTGGTL